MAVGYESAQVNNQLVNVAPGQAFAPLAYGAELSGPGFWPRNGVFNTPPVMPSPAISVGQAMSQTGTYGAGNPMPTAASVNGKGVNFFHPTKSPLTMGLIFLIVGILMLQYIHYR